MKDEELIEFAYNPFITKEQIEFLFNKLVRMACQKKPQEIIINIREKGVSV